MPWACGAAHKPCLTRTESESLGLRWDSHDTLECESASSRPCRPSLKARGGVSGAAGRTSLSNMVEAHVTRESGAPFTGQRNHSWYSFSQATASRSTPATRRARKLLTKGWAVVWKRYPFTIRLKDRTAA